MRPWHPQGRRGRCELALTQGQAPGNTATVQGRAWCPWEYAVKRRHMRWRSGPVLLLLGCSLNALADGGQECLARRVRTPAEARLAQDIVAALKAALPVPPTPWQRVDVTEPRPPTAQVYATPDCPETHSIKAVYRDDGAALAAAQALQAHAACMEALIAELQDALAKADTQRIQSLNAELLRLQSGSAAAITTVAIEVNGRGSTAPDAGGQPLNMPGTRAAYLYGQGSEQRVVMWLGDAAQRPGTDKGAEAGAALSNAHARHAVVSVAGPTAETFARLVRLSELQAVLKRGGAG